LLTFKLAGDVEQRLRVYPSILPPRQPVTLPDGVLPIEEIRRGVE
jgi:hypothetical protein